MKLKYKLPLILFLAFVAIVTPTFVVFLFSNARTSEELQYEMGRAMADACAETVRGFFSLKTTEIGVLKNSLGLKVAMNLDDASKEIAISQQLYAAAERMGVTNVFVTFERGAYFSAERTDPGTYFGIEAFRAYTGGVEVSVDPSEEVDYEEDDWFTLPKETGKMLLTEPYRWTYPGETQERSMITLTSPLLIDDRFVGVVGIDIELSFLQTEVIDGLADSQTGSYAILLSNEGLRVAHPRENMLFVKIGHDMEGQEQQDMWDAVTYGRPHRVVKRNNQTGEISVISYAPVFLRGIEAPLSLGFVFPLATSGAVQDEMVRARNTTLITGALCAIAWGIFLLLFMSRVFGKVTRTVGALGSMTAGDGDLTVRLKDRGKDELGQMSEGLNGFIEKLHLTIKTTQEEVKNLSDSSTTLFGLSQKLSESSEATHSQSVKASNESREVNGKVQDITSEAERMSANAAQLSATADQMGQNMSSMVGVVGDMGDSFGKMTTDARKSKEIASKTMDKVADAKSVMDVLNAAAKEIGQFTNVIKGIAQKTNLLALNATVEAARAGEAGKGFAVVAGEVKQLANQSSESADDITRRIESMQDGTSNAIKAINEVSDIASEINGLVNAIFERIEQQIKASEDLANSAKQTNSDVKQVVAAIGGIANSVQISAQNAGNAAHGTEIVSENISSIKESAEKTRTFSAELKEMANMLKDMSVNLDSIVGKFKA
ncbi:MAG: methyl-accepting chemotaxis protein [Chitinispirillales bacterium]|jgi:methyl-accepting chemotaxis protein|nr:methyl-accepting chemotaxis protein [Chitinispirillales bacterium]